MGNLLAYGTINGVVIGGILVLSRRSFQVQRDSGPEATLLMDMGLGGIALDEQGQGHEASKKQGPHGLALFYTARAKVYGNHLDAQYTISWAPSRPQLA